MCDEIIVLGETVKGWGDDARLVWELLAAGYTNVKMVDGGYSALKAYGAPTQMMASKPEKGEVEIEAIDYSHVMTTEELLANYDAYTIVDVRTDEEYNGAILNNEAQGGRLPGAIHIRYTDLFKADGTLKSNDELTKMFEDAGLTKEEAKNHPQKNLIIKAIGMENELELDFEIIETKPGDIFLLCSDGLTSMVSDEDILHIIIRRKKDLQNFVINFSKIYPNC